MTLPRLLGFSFVVLVVATASTVSAQTAPVSSQEALTRLTLVIETQRVRFTTPGEALDWRLEISDLQGLPVFDSAFVTGTALDWTLVDAQGQPVASGVYRYAVTIRGPQGSRTSRGQLTIERTSTLYQVAVNGEETASGTSLAVVNASAALPNGDTGGATAGSIQTNLGRASFAAPQPYISGTGTTGRMTRWADGPTGVVGDTNVTESNGSVVVGNNSFTGNLHIFGPAGSDVFAGMGPDLISGPGFNYGYAGSTFGRSAGFFNVRPDGSAVAPNPSLRFMTANVERMIVTNAGDVGIGTTSPTSKLRVVATGFNTGVLASSSSGAGVVGTSGSTSGVHGSSTSGTGVFGDSGSGEGVHGESSSSYGIYGSSVSSYAGYFSGNVYVTGTVTQSSDVRLKRDVANLSYGLREVLQLRPVTWTWKDRADRGRQLGLIAQEIEPVLPELVTREKDERQTLGLNYIGLMPVVINAIQEEHATIQALQAENAALKARLAAIEQALTSMGLPRKQ